MHASVVPLLFATPMDCSLPGSSQSIGFFRQEYWSGLLCPPPGDLPNPGIESASPVAPALQVDSLPTEPPGKPMRGMRIS